MQRQPPGRPWKLDGFKPSSFRGGYFGRSGAILQKIIFAPSAFVIAFRRSRSTLASGAVALQVTCATLGAPEKLDGFKPSSFRGYFGRSGATLQ